MRAWPRRRLDQERVERAGPKLRHEELFLTTAAGYRVAARVHEPDDDRARAGVVLVPGRGQTGAVFEGSRYLVSARELAARGVRAVYFDPVGRGRSWGHDDFCGEEGQDSLRSVLEFALGRRNIDPDRLDVATFSMGLALAAPVLARDADRLQIHRLVDWEGPADRRSILRGGPLPPAARAALARDPEGFWALREPLEWIGRIRCGYHRLQAELDHTGDPDAVEGAMLLVATAARGSAKSTRLNDNRPDTAWRPAQREQLRWAPSEATAINRLLLGLLTSEVDEEERR